MVARAGKGALMAKADIESAFRLLPVHPNDHELLGMKVDGNYYVDKALPMGASCSPALFETFSTFLEWATKRASGSDGICHFCDDFLFVSPAEAKERRSCHCVVHSFDGLCDELGVPRALDKFIGPTTKLIYLGLELNSMDLTVSVPADKLAKIAEKIRSALRVQKMPLRELQSLIGSLSFVCKAIAPGRAFLRRLIDLLKGGNKPWHSVQLTKGAKEDLKMWSVFLQSFNGKSIIPEQFWREDRDIQLFTDASGSLGFGGFLKGKWFQGRWDPDILGKRSIAWMEFFPVLVSLVLWGNLLRGKRIIVRSDNEAVVAILNKQTSRCPDIMKLVRFFVLQCLKLNVGFKARHIPGKDNDIADALSRFQEERFRQLAPGADLTGGQVPHFLWEL